MYCGRKMPSNPFSSLERQNFPDFSPVFARSNTPASEEVKWDIYNNLTVLSVQSYELQCFILMCSSQRNASFRWSIDQLARLVSGTRCGFSLNCCHSNLSHDMHMCSLQKPAEIETDPTTLVKTNGHR